MERDANGAYTFYGVSGEDRGYIQKHADRDTASYTGK